MHGCRVCWSGNFLDDYTNKSNLHIAITDSNGEVVEFDRLAITNYKNPWKFCVALIHIIAQVNFHNFCTCVRKNKVFLSKYSCRLWIHVFRQREQLFLFLNFHFDKRALWKQYFFRFFTYFFQLASLFLVSTFLESARFRSVNSSVSVEKITSDPDPAKWCVMNIIRIRIRSTAACPVAEYNTIQYTYTV